MHRRTLSILVISLVCVVALVVAALAAAPPSIGRALEAQKRLTAERPNDPAVFNDLGNLFLLAHQPEDAEQAYRKAVALDSKRVSALFNLGLLLQQRGEAKQALDFYRQVLDAQPEHAWAHYQAGALYEAGGQTSKAVGEYARAFSLDPQLAFREVNPQIVDNKLVTQAMLQAYRQGYGEPQVPAVYEDAHRIADLLVPPPTAPADAGKDAAKEPVKDATAKPVQPSAPIKPAAGAAQPPGATVIRPGDLDNRVTGQAGQQGVGVPGRSRVQPNSRMPQIPQNVPRGMREWERPEPTVGMPNEGSSPPIPTPGQVITPPPGGVYYRPGYQSTGRLNIQVLPANERDARG